MLVTDLSDFDHDSFWTGKIKNHLKAIEFVEQCEKIRLIGFMAPLHKVV